MDRKRAEDSLSSILDRLGNWFQTPQSARRPKSRMRKLGLESLEGRRVLSTTPAALIQGVVFNDAAGTGQPASGEGIQGATISLYQGTADISNDTLVGTTTTNYAGDYTFSGLSAGTYYVAETSAPGGYSPASSTPQEVVISAAAAAGSVYQTIDNFASSQSVMASSTGALTSASTVATSDAIGGYRNLYAQLTSAYGEIDLSSNAWNQGLLEYNSSATGYGARYIAWDGNNSANPTVINYTGLGGIDLTSGGQATGIEFDCGADHDNGTLTFIIYTNADNYSQATVTIPNTGGASSGMVYVPLDSFTIGGGSGANFASVGAMVMKITGNAAVNGQVSAITDVGPTAFTANFANYQKATVGTFAFWDDNSDGVRDNGDPGAANVTVQLLQAGSVVATTTTNSQGAYSFAGLSPGTYSVKFITPDGSKFTTELVGGNAAINSDVDPATGVSPAFTLTSGESLTTVDAGLLPIDLTVAKSVSDATPLLGSNVTFTVNLSNATGYSQATDVTLSDVLPAGMTFVSASASQGTYNSSAGAWSVGTVASGSSAVLTVVATVATAGAKTNVATISGADENDIATATQLTSSATVTPVLPVDLAITKTVDNATPSVGANVTFTITLSDLGPGNGTDVVASDVLPAGLTYVSSSATQGTYNSSSGVWTVGSVNYGGPAATLTIVANVATAGAKTNTATITSLAETDPNLSNNTASVTVTPDDTDDDGVTKSVDNPLPTVGTDVTFTITAGNFGPGTSTNTTATDLLPAGLTFVSYTASQGTYNAATGLWTIGTLTANAPPITLTVTALVTAQGLMTNTVTITSDEVDSDPSDNTASAIVIGQPPANNNVVSTPPPSAPLPSKYSYLGR